MVDVSQLGIKEIENLADRPPGETAKPAASISKLEHVLRLKKLIGSSDDLKNSAYADIARDDFIFYDKAAEYLKRSAKLRAKFGYKFESVEKLAEVLESSFLKQEAESLFKEADPTGELWTELKKEKVGNSAFTGGASAGKGK